MIREHAPAASGLVPTSTADGAATRRIDPRRPARVLAWIPTLALAAVTIGCEPGDRPPPLEPPRGADQVVTGLSTHITAAGRRALRVNGGVAYVYNDSSTVWIEQASATAYDD
jgi:hypothetical protein